MEPSTTGMATGLQSQAMGHAVADQQGKMAASGSLLPPQPAPQPQTMVMPQAVPQQQQQQWQPPLLLPTPQLPRPGAVQPALGIGSQPHPHPQATQPQLQSQGHVQGQFPPRPAIQGANSVSVNPQQPMLQFPFPMIQDPVILAQLTGFDPKMLATHPTMMVAAQQIFAQRVLQHQLLSSGAFGARPQMVPYGSMPRPARPPFVGPAASSGIPATATGVAAEVEQNRTKPQKSARTTPAGSKKEKTPKTAKQDGPSSSTKKVKRPYSEKTAAQTGLLKPEQPEKKSKVEAVPKLAVEAEPEPESEPIINRDDPGGRIVWAKVANYPWWPAKTLDPAKDRSFPRNADRPRPNAIPVRFFGTHDFGWLGSKRALEEWEEGKQKSRIEECDQASFKEAVKEAEVYLEQKTLPDAFYMSPRLESGKRGKSSTTSRKRSSSGGVGHGKKALIIKDPIQRRAMIMERKKRRLLDWGLLPPPQSPYGLLNGRVAPNQQLLDVCRKHWDGVVSMKDITLLHKPRPFRGMMDVRTTKNEDTNEKPVTIGINDIDKPVADIHKDEPTPIENANVEQKVDP